MKKQLFLITLCLLTVGVMVAENAASTPKAGKMAIPTKIAYVDMGKIFTEDLSQKDLICEEWIDRIQAVQSDYMKRVKDFTAKKDNYEKLVAEFQTQKDKMSPSKMEDLQKLRDDLAREAQAAESYQMRAVQEIQAEIYPKIQKAATTIAQRQGWDRVDFTPALYVAPATDITAEVIAEMNKEYRAQKAAQKFKKTEK